MNWYIFLQLCPKCWWTNWPKWGHLSPWVWNLPDVGKCRVLPSSCHGPWCYVAVCQPFCSSVLMNHGVWLLLASICWFVGSLDGFTFHHGDCPLCRSWETGHCHEVLLQWSPAGLTPHPRRFSCAWAVTCLHFLLTSSCSLCALILLTLPHGIAFPFLLRSVRIAF